MNPSTSLGRIVWHDLFSHDVDASKRFYGDLFGFEYIIEHSSDFAWGGGAGDYVLMSDGIAAHSGIVGTPKDGRSGWLAFVAVDDVDNAATRAQAAGATIVREPFDVPGVGRSCLVEDIHGAQIAPFVPTHTFSAPSGLFVWAELTAPDPGAISPMYETVFGWRAGSAEDSAGCARCVFETPHGDSVAGISQTERSDGYSPGWVPFLGTSDLDQAIGRAVSLGAQTVGKPVQFRAGRPAQVLQDPLGTVFGLTSA